MNEHIITDTPNLPHLVEVKRCLDNIAQETLIDRMDFEDLGSVTIYYIVTNGKSPIQALEYLKNSIGDPLHVDKARSRTNIPRYFLALLGIESQNEFLLHYQIWNMNWEVNNILIYVGHSGIGVKSRMYRIRSLENTALYRDIV